MEPKAQLFSRLDEARENLWRALASISDDAQITPGMTKHDVFAHIAGWEALVFEVLRENVYGVPASKHPYSGADALNREFLAQRQNQTVESAKLECEINRFAINTALREISDEDFGKAMHFPWGDESPQVVIQAAIDHEIEHLGEVLHMKREVSA